MVVLSKMKADQHNCPVPAATAEQRKAREALEQRERLERLASAALAQGDIQQLNTLISREREAFEQYAPEALARVRAARLEQVRCAQPLAASDSSDTGFIAVGPRLRIATPVWTVAPMVTQCDAPFRQLMRRHGARLVYSEMLMATEFAASASYRATGLGLTNGSDRLSSDDHPLVVQFAVNQPQTLVRAGLAAQRCGADAIDINLGCPQNRAREGHYGSFLTDPHDWPLCCAMVRACVECPELTIPVTCKIRLQKSVEATIEFARMLEAAGCSLLAVHGRRRGNEKHRRSGPADLDAIAAVKAALTIPVLSNGNVSSCVDALDALRQTRCDGVMSAEEVLRDPALFRRCDLQMAASAEACEACDVSDVSDAAPAERVESGADDGADTPSTAEVPDAVQLSSEYLSAALLRPPSSVWADERAKGRDLALAVAEQHVSRMLKNLVGARDFLEQPQARGATTVADFAAAFRLHFAPHLKSTQTQWLRDEVNAESARRAVSAVVRRK